MKIDTKEKALEFIEILKKDEKIEFSSIFENTGKYWDYYFSITGFFDGYYFDIYIYKTKQNNPVFEMTGNSIKKTKFKKYFKLWK
jgi:hypothetical protein